MIDQQKNANENLTSYPDYCQPKFNVEIQWMIVVECDRNRFFVSTYFVKRKLFWKCAIILPAYAFCDNCSLVLSFFLTVADQSLLLRRDQLTDYSFHPEGDQISSKHNRFISVYSELIFIDDLTEKIINCKVISAAQVQSFLLIDHLFRIKAVMNNILNSIVASLDLYQFRTGDIDAVGKNYNVAASADQESSCWRLYFCQLIHFS